MQNHRGIELFSDLKCVHFIYTVEHEKIWIKYEKNLTIFFIFNFNLSVFLYCFFKEVIRLFSDIFLSHYWPYQNVLLLPTKYYTIIFILKKPWSYAKNSKCFSFELKGKKLLNLFKTFWLHFSLFPQCIPSLESFLPLVACVTNIYIKFKLIYENI